MAKQQVQPDPQTIRCFLFIRKTSDEFTIIIGNSLAGVLVSVISALGGAAFAKSAALAAFMKLLGH